MEPLLLLRRAGPAGLCYGRHLATAAESAQLSPPPRRADVTQSRGTAVRANCALVVNWIGEYTTTTRAGRVEWGWSREREEAQRVYK